MEETTASPYTYTYRMISRLQSDCDYFLGFGNRQANVLWAGSVTEQIAEMRRLWNCLPDDAKPEWLTWEQIDAYEAQMLESPTN